MDFFFLSLNFLQFKRENNLVTANYFHPDSGQSGEKWMKKIISFDKLKITNASGNPSGQV